MEFLWFSVVTRSSIGIKLYRDCYCWIVGIYQSETIVCLVFGIQDWKSHSYFLAESKFLLESHDDFSTWDRTIVDSDSIKMTGWDIIVQIICTLIKSIIRIIWTKSKPDFMIVCSLRIECNHCFEYKLEWCFGSICSYVWMGWLKLIDVLRSWKFNISVLVVICTRVGDRWSAIYIGWVLLEKHIIICAGIKGRYCCPYPSVVLYYELIVINCWIVDRIYYRQSFGFNLEIVRVYVRCLLQRSYPNCVCCCIDEAVLNLNHWTRMLHALTSCKSVIVCCIRRELNWYFLHQSHISCAWGCTISERE